MVEIKTDASLDAMREAGRVVAAALAAARKEAAVGVSLRELDEAARAVLREAGAGSPFLCYRPHFAPTPFPAVICASVTSCVVSTIGTGSPGLRARWISASIETSWSRRHAATSAITPGLSTTMRRK